MKSMVSHKKMDGPSQVTSYGLTRRKVIGLSLAGASIGTGLLSACASSERPLRIASNTFPSYEIFHAAAELGILDPKEARMIRMPSATACLHALAAGILEGACLTLDEVITAMADKLPLRIIAVLNISVGADMLLTRPDVTKIEQLKGKRIGIEQSAVGAVMLDAAIRSSNLEISDVELVYATVDEHQAIFEQGLVDALVTFEPVASRVIDSCGASRLFDSAKAPGKIVDVLAVTPTAALRRAEDLSHLVEAYSETMTALLSNDGRVRASIANGLSIPVDNLDSAYQGLHLLSREENDAWFDNGAEKLIRVAEDLQAIMLEAGLVSEKIDLSQLAPVERNQG